VGFFWGVFGFFGGFLEGVFWGFFWGDRRWGKRESFFLKGKVFLRSLGVFFRGREFFFGGGFVDLCVYLCNF
jgi:hypothetical protein